MQAEPCHRPPIPRRTHRTRTDRNPSRSSRKATVFRVVGGADQSVPSRGKFSSPDVCRRAELSPSPWALPLTTRGNAKFASAGGFAGTRQCGPRLKSDGCSDQVAMTMFYSSAALRQGHILCCHTSRVPDFRREIPIIEVNLITFASQTRHCPDRNRSTTSSCKSGKAPSSRS